MKLKDLMLVATCDMYFQRATNCHELEWDAIHKAWTDDDIIIVSDEQLNELVVKDVTGRGKYSLLVTLDI